MSCRQVPGAEARPRKSEGWKLETGSLDSPFEKFCYREKQRKWAVTRSKRKIKKRLFGIENSPLQLYPEQRGDSAKWLSLVTRPWGQQHPPDGVAVKSTGEKGRKPREGPHT